MQSVSPALQERGHQAEPRMTPAAAYRGRGCGGGGGGPKVGGHGLVAVQQLPVHVWQCRVARCIGQFHMNF